MNASNGSGCGALGDNPDKGGVAAVVRSGKAKLAAIKIDMKSFLSMTTLPWVES